jgi:formylglycine-generating enzyme required for sulfatase activity/tetratricopeptide (TPR) repeat protein
MRAYETLCRSGSVIYFPEYYVSLARFNQRMGYHGKAVEAVDEALRYAQEYRMPLYEADANLQKAECYLNIGDSDQAGDCFEIAEKIIEECGYGRRRDDLDALLSRLGEPYSLDFWAALRSDPSSDQERVYRAYLSTLREESQAVSLSAIGPDLSAQTPRILLSDVYIEPLLTGGFSTPSQPSGRLAPRPALQRLAGTHRRFSILRGDAGSGKSTLVANLIYRITDANFREAASELGEPWGPLIPVRLRPVDMNWVTAGANAKLIWTAVRQTFERCCGEASGTRLFETSRRYLRTRGLFLLDGLDEVPETDGRRQRLLDALEIFAAGLGPKARILVTARPCALADRAPRGFAILDMAPFGTEQIEQFLEKWGRATATAAKQGQSARPNPLDALRSALNARPALADLAGNPLLLTLMVVSYGVRGDLPTHRADLYEAVVERLITHWSDYPYGFAGTPISPEPLREGLQDLAFFLQLQHSSNPEGVATDTEVKNRMAQYLPSDVAFDVVLQYFEQGPSLLVPLSGDRYAFLHHAVQDYLAACHWVEHGKESGLEAINLAPKDPVGWREVFLLAVVRAARTGPSAASEFLMSMAPPPRDEVGTSTQDNRQAAILVGLGLLELEESKRPLDLPSHNAVKERLIGWLVEVVAQGYLTPQERAEAEDVLGRLGDPRTGVGLDKDRIPAIDWVSLPGRRFTMGEGAARQVKTLEPFAISRYPVTVAQYLAFISAGGYSENKWWDNRGIAWRDRTKRGAPKDWERQVKRPNRPVVSVSWYEANAFCAWLGAKLGRPVSLPSEAQWEYAASGTDGRAYPWGEDWDVTRANTRESEIGHATTAGMYPPGASPFGVLDLAGNNLEWCADPRPDVADHGNPKRRGTVYAARGGSYWRSAEEARTRTLAKFPATASDPDMGLRLTTSAPVTDTPPA